MDGMMDGTIDGEVLHERTEEAGNVPLYGAAE